MGRRQNLYSNVQWYEFSEKVQKRDGYKFTKCGRGKDKIVLQTHHKFYKPGIEVWEYATSDCISLCKGCHAMEHGIIEPADGWTLLSIDDLGGLDGVCEKKGCNNDIRYEHLIFHPSFGYKTVGSTCVEYLTREDQNLSADVIKLYKKISDFIKHSSYEKGTTKAGKSYQFTKYKHHQIRIYGTKGLYSYQICLKMLGMKKFNYSKIFQVHNKPFEQVEELSYIALQGMISEDESEKVVLRDLYKKLK
jgi:hypothetical protein